MFQEKSKANTLYFWDGERKIDLVLAYEEEEDVNSENREKRKTFERNLQEKGLQLELEPSYVSTWRFSRFQLRTFLLISEVSRQEDELP